MNKKKFCFFGNVANSLVGKTAGGGELQIALLAKALASNGHEVTIIDPYASHSFCTPEGVKLIHMPEWNAGIRGLRFLFNRIPYLYRTLRDQKADYYYIRMRSFLHMIPYAAARKNKAVFIQAMAQDMDVFSFPEQMKYEFSTNHNLSKLFFVTLPSFLVSNYLLKRADIILLQHSGQKFSNRKSRGRQVVFPNIIDHHSIIQSRQKESEYFVQVGTLTEFKGSAELFSLIQSLDKSVKIMIIGVPGDAKSALIYKQLESFPNVELKGRLDHAETLNCISGAKALINTSGYEGFPNIFLEAWASGTPVISLNVNPGEVINIHRLGVCCNGSSEAMKKTIEDFSEDSFDADALKAYINAHHDFVSAAERFEQLVMIDVYNPSGMN